MKKDDFLEDDRNLISNGKTLLMLTCIHENYEMMEVLLKHHTDASFKNFEGNTALHFACQMRNINAAKLLLKYNSNLVHISNKKEKTPLMIACKLGDDTMVSLLLKYNANINHKDHHGKTPLMIASKYNHSNAINLLLDQHALHEKNNNSISNGSNNKNKFFSEINASYASVSNDEKLRKFKMNKLKYRISNIAHSYSQSHASTHTHTHTHKNTHTHYPIKSTITKKSSKLLNNNIGSNAKKFMNNSYAYLLNKFKVNRNNSKSKTSKLVNGGILNNIIQQSNVSSIPVNLNFNGNSSSSSNNNNNNNININNNNNNNKI